MGEGEGENEGAIKAEGSKLVCTVSLRLMLGFSLSDLSAWSIASGVVQPATSASWNSSVTIRITCT